MDTGKSEVVELGLVRKEGVEAQEQADLEVRGAFAEDLRKLADEMMTGEMPIEVRTFVVYASGNVRRGFRQTSGASRWPMLGILDVSRQEIMGMIRRSSEA
jgi:hypothetical protein